MRDRPILFSAPMVRAVLDGTKTQTRRVVKPLGDATGVRDVYHRPDGNFIGLHLPVGQGCGITEPFPCPYGLLGDRLWVREAWKTNSLFNDRPPRDVSPGAKVFYLADGGYSPDAARYRHARFMPRWASRITLEVTGVRVERLQDISYEDALAEGVGDTASLCEQLTPNWRSAADETIQEAARRLRWPQRAFENLWVKINGAASLVANPWVWVVEFKRVP